MTMREAMHAVRLRAHRKIAWWRQAYRFNWAHKPLCTRFSREVLHLRHLHLCRSCTLLDGGLLASGIALLSFDIRVAALSRIFYPLLAIIVTFSHPGLYRRMPRGVRDLLRLGAGVLIALCLGLLVRGAILPALGGAATLFASHRVYMRGRPERKRRACDGCRELAAGGVCSGFREQAAVVRRYQDQLAAERTEELRLQGGPGPERLDGWRQAGRN